MKKSLFLLVLLASALAAANAFFSETVQTADAFVDSIGVNTHFSYTDAIYHLNFPLVKQALVDLKIRHIRDGMHTVPSDLYKLMNELGDAGIGCNYIVDPWLSKKTCSTIRTASTISKRLKIQTNLT
jgi:hypothetical protein